MNSIAPQWLVPRLAIVRSWGLLVSALAFHHLVRHMDLAAAGARDAALQREIAMLQRRQADAPQVATARAEIRHQTDALNALVVAQRLPTERLIELSRILSPCSPIAPYNHPTADPELIERLRYFCGREEIWSPTWNPQRLAITSFEVEGQRVSLTGEAQTRDDVSELLRRLRLSRYFEDPRRYFVDPPRVDWIETVATEAGPRLRFGSSVDGSP